MSRSIPHFHTAMKQLNHSNAVTWTIIINVTVTVKCVFPGVIQNIVVGWKLIKAVINCKIKCPILEKEITLITLRNKQVSLKSWCLLTDADLSCHMINISFPPSLSAHQLFPCQSAGTSGGAWPTRPLILTTKAKQQSSPLDVLLGDCSFRSLTAASRQTHTHK